jgi:hypothetical protein
MASHPLRHAVWYASYGSNLFATRFACYIQGGRPAGSTRTCTGARDKRPPVDSVAFDIPYRLYFTGTSQSWGGSPAFIDTHRSDAHRSLVRAYLISWEQFEDVVAQENSREVAPISVGHLSDGAIDRIGPGRYDTLLCLGERDEVPIVTITAPWTLSTVVPGEPSLAYLAMLIAGLREAHELGDEDIVDYLAAAPGCTTALARLALVTLA